MNARAVWLAASCALMATASVAAENWPSFRGPQGTGVVAATAGPLTWTDATNLLWRTPLAGPGNSTPAVWGDKAFVTQAAENGRRRTLLCFDLQTGKQLWEAGVTAEDNEPTNKQNPYCSASPATDGQFVVASYGSPGLFCYDFEGKEVWRHDFGDVDSWHGSGSSPLIHDGVCYLNFGPGTQSLLAACDVATGEVLWKAELPQAPGMALGFLFGGRRERGGPPRGDREGPPPLERAGPPGDRPFRFGGESAGAAAGEDLPDAGSAAFIGAGRAGDFSGQGGFNGSWATPVVVNEGEREVLVVVQSGEVAAYDPKSGEPVWKCGGLPPQVFASPAIGDGLLVAMGHRIPTGTEVVAVKTGGRGDVTDSHKLWTHTLRRECVASGVIHDGLLYLVSDLGVASCYEAATGDKRWEKRLRGKGASGGVWSSLVAAGDKLIVANLSGEVFVLAAGPEYQLLHSNYVGDETLCASPVVLPDSVLLRTYDALWRFGGAAR